MSTPPSAVGGRIDAQNPWPGLSAFNEAAQRFFHGRDAESAELLRLVGQAPLTVLFSKSGLGKTSLVQAGLFPRLRQQNILPIYVRLDVRDRSAPLVQQAAAALQAEISKHGVDAAAPDAGQSLWEHLHGRDVQWWSPRNQPLLPLFVLDQFEEVFTLGAENTHSIERLRLDLADLIENRLPLDLAQRIEKGDLAEQLDLRSQRYKVLLSFREDFLPEVEGWKGELPSVMRNRLRLLPMNADRAVQVVSGNAPTGRTHELVSDETAREIVRFVAAAQAGDDKSGRGTSSHKAADLPWEQSEIEPALLSLVCEGLNEKRKARAQATIDAALLKETGNAIIGDFYQRCVADVPDRTRRFIEDALITEGGFRNSYPLQDAVEQGVLTEPLLRRLVDRRLLRIDHQLGADRVELIHDRLTRVVREHRDLERERLRIQKQRRRQWLAGSLVVVLLTVSAMFFLLWQRTQTALQRATALKLAIESKTILSGSLPGGTSLGLQLALASFKLAAGPDTFGAIQSAEQATAALLWIREVNGPFAFSPDGRRIASGSADGSLQIWDITGGVLLAKSPKGHAEAILSIAFSPNGERIVSGGQDKTLRLWDAATATPLGKPLSGHSEAIYGVAFSPDSTRIVSASGDKTLRLWDATTGASLGMPFEGHGGAIVSVAYSPDGNQIVSGSVDYTLRRWNAATYLPIGMPLGGHEGEVVSVAYSPDGQRIVSGGYDRRVCLWDAVTGVRMLEGKFEGHTDGVQSVAFSPDGKRIVSGSWDTSIRLWDSSTGDSVGEPLVGHTDKVWSAAFSPDGAHIGSRSADGTLRLWNAGGDLLVGHAGPVTSVAFSQPDGKQVFSGGYDQTVRLWDVATGQFLGDRLKNGHTDKVTSIALSPDGQRIASGGMDGTVLLHNAVTGLLLGESRRAHSRQVSSLAFSPDGKRLASGGWDGTVRLWDGATGAPIAPSLTGYDNAIFGVAFSPDGKRLVSGSWSGTLLLQDATTGAIVGVPHKEHSGVVSSVAFSPDNKLIVSGGHDGTLRLWNAVTGAPFGEPLRGHSRQVTSVAFSPDGKLIVSGAHDQTLRLWDAATGTPLGEPLKGHHDAIFGVAFSPDSTRIVSGSVDQTVRLWRVGQPERLCAKLARNLSPSEWKRYVGDIRYVTQCAQLPVPPPS